MAAEVQGALHEAAKAQACEDEGDTPGALECYLRAACQLAYVADLQADKGSALAAMCHGLVQMYEQRTAVLAARQDTTASGQHTWVQLDLASSCAPPPAPATMHAAHGPAQQQSQHQTMCIFPAQQMQPMAIAAAAAAGSEGAGELQQVVDSEMPSPSGGCSRASLELLRSCQRAVSGSLDDVLGLETVKDALEEAVFMPMRFPHLFRGIRQPPRTFLLHGPPGTGKTLLVEKTAAEADLLLLSVSPAKILSKWAGESERTIAAIFDLAKSLQPCIIFLDEVDSIGQARGATTDAGARRLLTELLVQFTQAAGEEGVFVFGATNRMQDCDPALLRRFARRIEVPLPDAAARSGFFAAVLARPELDADLSTDELRQLVRLSDGYSGSDLADVCRTAALAPVRDLMLQQRMAGGAKRRRRGSLRMRAAAASEQGGGGAGRQQAPGGEVQLRKLVLADFKGALAAIRPALLDAAAGGD